MAANITRNKINFKGKTVSIGIDTHKRSWHITALANGEIVLTVTTLQANKERPYQTFGGSTASEVYWGISELRRAA